MWSRASKSKRLFRSGAGRWAGWVCAYLRVGWSVGRSASLVYSRSIYGLCRGGL